jgi:drug/metabolite transporter (DMT)-like permease
MSVLAYSLVLVALALAPLALVAPVRESGILVVALWGVLRLDERERALRKLTGATAVLCGVALVAAG